MTIEKTTCNVRVKGCVPEYFSVKTGLCQGDTLSTLLFNMLLEKIVRNSTLAEYLLYKNHQLRGYGHRQGLQINRKTIKVMRIGKINKEQREFKVYTLLRMVGLF